MGGGMLTSFPTPVLSIAADAVRDLEGREALSSLWALLTKCKESLQDGRRFENMLWRLWYREMMRDDFKNRLYQENESEKVEQVQEKVTSTDLYTSPTPSVSESIPPTPFFAVQDASRSNHPTVNYQPSFISATLALPQDHDHATSSPTFSSSSLNPTLDTTFRSISPVDPAPYPALDSPPASLQLSKSKSKSDTVLSPGVPAEQSASSSGPKPPYGSADIIPQYTCASSVQPKQRRRLSGLDARINSHTESSAPAPVCVGRIIYDMLPRSESKGSKGSSSWIKELQIGLRWAEPSSMTTTTPRTLTAVESIPTPVMDPYSVLQPPALTPTMRAGSHADTISSTTATITTIPSTPGSTTSTMKYTSLHMAPPSPSLSDSYARAHPGEVEVSDAMHLEPGVGLGPSLSVSASSPSSPEVPGNAHIVGLSPNLQLPPRVVVVNPTPNLTPHPTPPASPLLTASTSKFASVSSVASTSTATSNNHRDWLMLPPSHNPIPDSWQQTPDRSRSEDMDPVPSINGIGVKATTTDIKPIQPPPFINQHHQNVGEDQLLASSEPFVQDLETFTNTNSNRHSISSTTSTTDSTFSAAASTATAATTASPDEGSEEEEPWKMMENDNRWITGVTVVSPGGAHVFDEVDTHPVSESDAGGIGPSMRLGSLSTIHSMSVRRGGDREGDSAVFTSDEGTDVENDDELVDERGEGPSTRLMNTTTDATITMKKKKKVEMGTKTKTKAKTKPVKRNSLRSPTSTLSPPSTLNRSSSSSSTNQKQRTSAPPAAPLARASSTGRSSSRSASRSGGSCVGISAEKERTISSVSRSRSRENRGVGGALFGMTAAARATSGERKKPVLTIFTKPKQRPKFMLGRSGAKAGSGSTMIRRESSVTDPEGSGAGAGVNGDENEKEEERERGREQMMEIIQMQRRQQLLIQQQRQEEMKQGMEDEQRTLAAQLARQDADVRETEIRRQRQRHHLEQQKQGQEMQGGANGLLGVSSKRPVRFNIGSNSDEGSGVGSNSKSGSEISGMDGLVIPPVVHPTTNSKGKERDVGIVEQETKQQEQHQLQGDFRQPEHQPHPQQQRQMSKQELHQLRMMQQQHLHHQQRRQLPPHPQPLQQAIDRQLQQEATGKEREHSNANPNPKPNPKPNPAPSTSKADINNPPPAHNIKTKHSTHETLNLVSSALAAKVKHTLSDPLLPGQHKRTIVLSTSESDFEDSDDDGSWSSEEMGSEDEEEKQREEQQRQEQLLAQQCLQRQQQLQRQPQQQQQPQPQQPQPQHQHQPVQRTHSSNHLPGANHHNHTHANIRAQRNPSSRNHRHPPLHTHGQAPTHNQALMSQAANEARRQREMFAKKPTESFQNLTVARTRSVGLLTQLMNPNPEIFPVGHPYRRGYSSSEIRGVGGNANGDRGGVRDREIKPLLPLMDVKATKAENARDNTVHPPPSRPEVMHRKSSSSSAGGAALGHSRAMSALSPPARTLSMQLTKSTAALPVSSQVQAGSVSVNMPNGAEGGHGAVKDFGMTNRNMIVSNGHSSGGYRPKGPPQDQELEDESGSEAESGGGIQVSKSVAQEKLKALAERRGIVTHGNQPTRTSNAETNLRKQIGDEDDVPQWAKVSQPRQPTRTRSQDQYQPPQAPNNANRLSLNGHYSRQLNVSALNHTTPIPVGHPYNLPPPAPPSTPRTTRRLMLSTELSESLRRNLLWERQLSKVNLAAAMRRTSSGGGSRHSVLGGVQPLTTGPSMIQLHPKGTNRHPNPGSPARTKQESGGEGAKKERRASGGAIGTGDGPVVYDESEREQRKRLAMARNRSWANDYHYSGW